MLSVAIIDKFLLWLHHTPRKYTILFKSIVFIYFEMLNNQFVIICITTTVVQVLFFLLFSVLFTWIQLLKLNFFNFHCFLMNAYITKSVN